MKKRVLTGFVLLLLLAGAGSLSAASTKKVLPDPGILPTSKLYGIKVFVENDLQRLCEIYHLGRRSRIPEPPEGVNGGCGPVRGALLG